jgi:hypothetical protein
VNPKYKERGRAIRVMDTRARLFHVGSVKSGRAMQAKCETVSGYFQGLGSGAYTWEEAFFYQKVPRQFVARFEGTHPKVLDGWIRKHEWPLDLDSPLWRTTLTWKERWRQVQTFWSRHVSDRYPRRRSFRPVRE